MFSKGCLYVCPAVPPKPPLGSPKVSPKAPPSRTSDLPGALGGTLSHLFLLDATKQRAVHSSQEVRRRGRPLRSLLQGPPPSTAQGGRAKTPILQTQNQHSGLREGQGQWVVNASGVLPGSLRFPLLFLLMLYPNSVSL